jgi:desulfoferrodoxin (superoxide reductase-like protein)
MVSPEIPEMRERRVPPSLWSLVCARGTVRGASLVLVGLLGGCLAKVGDPLPPFKDPDPNPDWEAEAEELEGDKVYDENDQWMGQDLAASHVPNAQILSGKLSVTVPHPMQHDHYITAIYVRDQRGVIVGFQEFKDPAEGKDALGVTANFDVPLRATSVRAYAHCNQNDTWRSERLELE